MQTTILISGAGQLGSRYLQGLSECSIPLTIYIQDCYQESLQKAEHLWNEVSDNTIHRTSFHLSLNEIPNEIDITIVATTADVRPHVVSEISQSINVNYWVLEKVLAQSDTALELIYESVENCSGAWVNTPRRMMPWHQKIKRHLYLGSPLTLKVKGGSWGLACNAIHFIDLLSWWTGEKVESISTDHLSSEWFESKRKGYWEVFGTLEICFSGGTIAQLTSDLSDDSNSIFVNDEQFSWDINEIEGLAKRSDGMEITGKLPYQSEITAELIEAIISDGKCELPTLEESIALHRVFLNSMQIHWDKAGMHTSSVVPIT